MGSFEDVMVGVLRREGGYVNSPHDRGGETKYGISKNAYPHEDIRGLTIDRAMQLYRRDYWDRANVDSFQAVMRPMVMRSSTTAYQGVLN